MTTNILFLGFFLGASHALEIDHVAALGTMSSARDARRRTVVIRGAVWGAGHAAMLFLICCGLTALGWTMSGSAANFLELFVGLMLIWLGASGLYQLRLNRARISGIDDTQTRHTHQATPISESFPTKALIVGFVHGAAGSSALLALALATTQNMLTMASYVALFGLGSVAGMAALSYAITLPFGLLRRRRGFRIDVLLAILSVLAILVGALVAIEKITELVAI